VVWRILLVVAWVVAAVVLRMRGERFWRSVIQGLFVGVGVIFGVWLVALALLTLANSLG